MLDTEMPPYAGSAHNTQRMSWFQGDVNPAADLDSKLSVLYADTQHRVSSLVYSATDDTSPGGRLLVAVCGAVTIAIIPAAQEVRMHVSS